jgi:hypothetical protein
VLPVKYILSTSFKTTKLFNTKTDEL